MATSPDTFTQHLEKLIAKFEADKTHYLSNGYSEPQARVDFITPFFKALGWDVENEAGLPHHQREVIVERCESETTGRHDKIVTLVDRMLELNKKKHGTPPDRSAGILPAEEKRHRDAGATGAGASKAWITSRNAAADTCPIGRLKGRRTS